MEDTSARHDHRQHILIVDDEPAVLRVLGRYLEKAGYRVGTANTGFEAGVYLGHFLPDLITLDLRMPEMDGGEVLECIRKTDYLRHLKILVISGVSDKELEEAMRQGADACLKKPVEMQELLCMVHRLLGDGPEAG